MIAKLIANKPTMHNKINDNDTNQTTVFVKVAYFILPV